jgi:hypothetical protein
MIGRGQRRNLRSEINAEELQLPVYSVEKLQVAFALISGERALQSTSPSTNRARADEKALDRV